MKASFLSVSWINSGMKYYPTKTNPVRQTSKNILDRNIAGTLLARNRASKHTGESVKDIESFRNRKKITSRGHSNSAYEIHICIKMELFANIENNFIPLTIFTESSINEVFIQVLNFDCVLRFITYTMLLKIITSTN